MAARFAEASRRRDREGEVRIPRRASFGLLRATGQGDAGNTFKQEVIRAFSMR